MSKHSATKRRDDMLADLGVELWWADELWQGGGKRRPGWSGVADVFCSKRFRAVSVPRRRVGAWHFKEVIHEVAHLLRWVQTGQPPAKHNELVVCSDALELGRHYGFNKQTMEFLAQDLDEERMRRTKGARA